MRLILFHPGAAKLSCEQCVKCVTDLEAGEVLQYSKTDPATGQRIKVDQIRPQGTLPPCQRCPKESPERAKEIELSEKNWRAFVHFRQAREVGLMDEERRDPIVRRNFAILGAIVREFETGRGAALQATEFVRQLKR